MKGHPLFVIEIVYMRIFVGVIFEKSKFDVSVCLCGVNFGQNFVFWSSIRNRLFSFWDYRKLFFYFWGSNFYSFGYYYTDIDGYYCSTPNGQTKTMGVSEGSVNNYEARVLICPCEMTGNVCIAIFIASHRPDSYQC